MNDWNRRQVLASGVALALGAPAAGVLAQPGWPDRPIKVVVPYPPGGNTDSIARQVMKLLSDRLGQPIVIENKPGANSITGTDYVAKSVPDGHTLLIVIGAYANNFSLYKSLPFARDDLAPVSLLTRTSLVIVSARPEFKTLEDLVKAGRAGKQISFGSGGVGSAARLFSERFARLAGIPSTLHVPYKGSADAINDLLSGRIDFMFDAISAMGPHIKAGKLSALAVTSEKRSPLLPQVPSVAELGYADMVSYAWAGLLAPAKTPRAIVDRLSTEVAAALTDRELRAALEAISTEAIGGTPAQLAAFIDREVKVNGEVIRALQITLD